MIILETLTVEHICDLNLKDILIVEPDEAFSQVIQRFAYHSDLRGIYVTDAEGHLLGVITRIDLLDWARAKLGFIFRKPQIDQRKTTRLLNLMQASTAGQVMRQDSQHASVKRTDTLARALELMLELDLIVLPVVDDTNRIIGDLKLAKLLATPIEASKSTIKST